MRINVTKRLVFIKVVLASVLVVNLGFAASVSQQNNARIRAVSLGVLQKDLRAVKTDLPKQLAEFLSLTKILGYIVDEEHKDLVLYGETEPNPRKPLYLEDFVIALRNDSLKYAPLRGNTYTYTHPGCSIDPRPETVRKLDQVGNQINAVKEQEEVQAQLEKWHTTCKQLQNVRVLGIPFHTRFAAVMVKADYDMKLLVDGNDTLDLPGFNSLVDLKFVLAKNAILSNRPLNISLAGMNRFWFYPGPNRYEEDDGVVWIKQCPVVLLTEEMYSTKSGNLQGAQRSDPMAKKFTEDFSSLYGKIAEDRPIYAELEDLFRFVALAKIMHFRSADKKAGLDLDYLLNGFPIREVPVAPQLPGRSAVKEFSHRQELANGYQTYQLWMPSCGGVGIEIDVKPKHFEAPSAALRRLRKAILDARPSVNSLHWDLPTDHEAVATLREGARLTEANYRSELRATVSVTYKGPNLVLQNEAKELYRGESAEELLRALKNGLSGDKTAVHIQAEGFPENKLEAFIANCSKEYALDPKTRLVVNGRDATTAGFQDAVASRGYRIDPNFKATEEQSAGKTTVSFGLLAKWRGIVQKWVVKIRSPHPGQARAFQQEMLDALAPYNSSSESILDSVSRIHQLMKKKLGPKGVDVDVLIENELRRSQFGILIHLTMDEKG